ncbi:MAG: hypothetical protein K2P76_03410 [Lachnospiraceae bacterium]|nr:hypothetical protein [Lachnospiraceae bacterium]MDE6982216.1 hypothetical protein [Lachnospiraceae bacterium]
MAVNPTMTFNERGHEVNHLIYGVFGGWGEEKSVGFSRFWKSLSFGMYRQSGRYWKGSANPVNTATAGKRPWMV